MIIRITWNCPTVQQVTALDLLISFQLIICRYLAVIAHCFYTKNKKVWGVECDKFETFFTLHCVFRKNEGDWGNSCKHICRHKESTLTDYHFFQDFSGKFFHSKAVDFSNFLSLYKCWKLLTIKTTLMSLN